MSLIPWFKVDDNLAFHAKVLEAGNGAMGLWVRAGSWSMQTLTDGCIPHKVARQLGTRAEAKRLVDAGLWVEKDDGYEFHEWEQRQPSRAKVYTDREKNATKLRDWRERQREEEERRRREEEGETDA